MMLFTLCAWAEEEYDLWFQGTRVSSYNCDDLMWGMVRYDASSNTLFIENDVWINNDFVNDYAIVNNIAGLTIQFNGNNCGIEGMKGAIYSTEYFLISGNGANESGVMINDFNADSPAIYAEKGVTIKECNVAIYGVQDTGIEGEGILALNGGKLYCNVVKGFEDMQYSNGSYLAYPEGGQYDTVNKVLEGGYSYVQVDVRVGDMNDDGKQNAVDVVSMIKVLNNAPSDYYKSQVDVNADGSFTEEDVEALVDIILEKIEEM